MLDSTPRSLLIWRFCLCITLLGFALGHYFSDQYYRSVLWNQSLMEPIVSLWSITWDTWVTDTRYSELIDSWRVSIGHCFLLLSILCLWPWKKKLLIGFIILFYIPFMSMFTARWAAHGYDILWPLEFLIRLSLPIFYLFTLVELQHKRNTFITVMLIACSATFIGHGCYALNIHPTPVSFRYMLGNIISLESNTVDILLIAIGILDIAVALLLWWRPLRLPILLWMSFWGFLTSAMRLSFIDTYFLADTAGPAIADWLERLAHGFMPLACFLWLKHSTEESADDDTPPNRRKTVATEIM